MLFLVNLRPLPKIPAWGGVENAIYSKFTTPPQNQSLGRGRKYLIWYNYPLSRVPNHVYIKFTTPPHEYRSLLTKQVSRRTRSQGT